MAVSGSSLTEGVKNTSGTSFITASISPAGDNLLFLSFNVRNGSSVEPTVSSISGNGLTWVLVNSIYYDTAGSSRKKHFVYRAMGSSPSAGAVTVNFGQTNTNFNWSVDQFSGVDTGGTNGSGAVVQSAVAKEDGGNGGALTVTLAAFSSVNNATYGSFGDDSENAATEGSGFTPLSVHPSSATDHGLNTEYKTTNDTSVDMTFAAGTGVSTGGVAVEIKAAVTDVTVNAGVQPLTSSQPTATVTAIRNISVLAGVQTLTSSQQSPTISAETGVTVSPSAQSLTATQPTPTVTTVRHVTVSPNAQSVTSSQPTPAITVVRNLTTSPSVQTLTVSLPSPTVDAQVQADVTVPMDVVNVTASQPVATTTAIRNVTVSASVQEITSSVTSPTISPIRNVSVSQSVQSLTASQQSPAITAVRHATISPNALSLTVAILLPSVTSGGQSIASNVIYNNELDEESPTPYSLTSAVVYNDEMTDGEPEGNSIADRVFYDSEM